MVLYSVFLLTVGLIGQPEPMTMRRSQLVARDEKVTQHSIVGWESNPRSGGGLKKACMTNPDRFEMPCKA